MLDINYWNITKRDFVIPLQPGRAVNIQPGDGYVVEDIFFPKKAPKSPFVKSSLTSLENIPKSKDLISQQFNIFQSQSVEEEAQRLAIAFSARFGIVDAKAAYEKARKETSEKIVFYLVAECSAAGEQIDQNQIKWETGPSSERIDDIDKRLRQFLDDYGSHYVTQVYYGQKFFIRVTSTSQSSTSYNKMSASLNAVSLFWSAGANINSDAKNYLSSTECTIEASLIAGDVKPSSALYVKGFEEVISLISDIKNEKVKIESGPIACLVWSYYHTLDIDKYPKTRELFEQYSIPKPARSDFGIPKGTVIMWAPAEENFQRDSDTGAIIQVIPPDGWVLLIGNGVSDVTNRFPMAVNNPLEVWSIGGSPIIDPVNEITPTGSVSVSKGKRDGSGWQGEGDECMVANAKLTLNKIPAHNHGGENRPPYFSIFFIMKK